MNDSNYTGPSNVLQGGTFGSDSLAATIDVLPRETLVFNTSGVFRKEDYPWLVTARLFIKGGDGGAASDGTPGEKGETDSVLLTADELDAETRVVLGAPGLGSGGGADGEPGYARFDLYDQVVTA